MGITYRTEYETRTRDVPIERSIPGNHSNDSGDGIDSEPSRRYGNNLNRHGRYHAQGGYITSDSSDDAHFYNVTEYVTEEYQVAKKVPEVSVNSVPYQVARTDYVTEEFTVETLEPYEVAVEVPYTVERQVPYTVTHEVPYVVTEKVPYTVYNKVPYEENFSVPYEVTQRVDYTVIKKVPFITSSQVEVTEYEKEPYTIEKKFEQTEWDKAFFTVTIDEPYVVELWEHYTAQIQVPYEVTNIRDLTVWEIEEYTVSQEVPFVVENPTIVTDIQQEAYTEIEQIERPNDLPRDIQLAAARQANGASTSGSVQARVVNQGASSTIIRGSAAGAAGSSAGSSAGNGGSQNLISGSNRGYYGQW